MPFEADLMKRYPVSSKINYPENDVLACVVEVPELVSAARYAVLTIASTLREQCPSFGTVC